MNKPTKLTAALLAALLLTVSAVNVSAAPPRFTDLPPVADMFLPPVMPVPDFLPTVPEAVFVPGQPGLADLAGLPILPVLPEQGLLPVVPGQARLADLDGHWAAAAVLQAFSRGMVDVENNMVRPDAPLTRGEAAFAMERLISNNYQALVRLGFVYPGAAEPVVGVPANHPFLGNINVLARYGLVGQGVFLPDEAVTRQELAMLMLALLRRVPGAGDTHIPNAEWIVARYEDHAEIYDWARESVAVMTIGGLMGGSPDGRFRPADLATRAEGYTVLMSLERWLNQ